MSTPAHPTRAERRLAELAAEPPDPVIVPVRQWLTREPALVLIAVIAPLAQLLLSFTPWPATVTTSLAAAAAALAGLLTAALVRTDQLVPAIAGMAHALLVVALSLGVPLDSTQRALVMAMVGLVSAAFIRTQVDARTPAPEQPGRHTQLAA